ncbi:hypothetical protein WOLCODRAFT_165038 [Wolfiporia cocos MD-104 SS10]|uniref:Uncharacterized protein n=1 Tax=Wolfiporia cocos (strain MD-104) TaxID=742152 RepID=A0A2H3K770_WOLCO|nr:hypothetical protein WOLCODRAFT_165038 [Wolfiporia cocos MD-104 SS10]
MISNVNANTSIETERQNGVPLMARSSTKSANALLGACGKVFESTGHRDSGDDTAPQDGESEIPSKDVPGVPPPSEIAHQYTCWDPTAVAAGYAARLTADLRSFRGLFACIDDGALASDVLEGLFGEITKLEAAYRARRAKAEGSRHCVNCADVDEDQGEDCAHDDEKHSDSIDDAQDDEHEELLDAPGWREAEEVPERGKSPGEDEDGSHIEPAHRTPSPVVVEPTDGDYYGDYEVSVRRRSVDSHRSSNDADLVNDEELNSDAVDRPSWSGYSAGDDGHEASVSSDSDIDWRLDDSSAADIHSAPLCSPAPAIPAARALPLAPIQVHANSLDEAAPEQQPARLEHVRASITGLFGHLPAPFFAQLNAEIEAQAISPATACAPKVEALQGVHRREQRSRRARFDGPYRQHYLRHSSVPRGEGADTPASVQRNATAPDLSGSRAA